MLASCILSKNNSFSYHVNGLPQIANYLYFFRIFWSQCVFIWQVKIVVIVTIVTAKISTTSACPQSAYFFVFPSTKLAEFEIQS